MALVFSYTHDTVTYHLPDKMRNKFSISLHDIKNVRNSIHYTIASLKETLTQHIPHFTILQSLTTEKLLQPSRHNVGRQVV